MPHVSNLVKTIQDIMRKDAGTYGDAQRLEQLGWMFFLKIFDDREKEFAITKDDYRSPIPARLRWSAWATDADAISPTDLRKTILTLAVQGRLVPQDSADNDAREMVDRAMERRRQTIRTKSLRKKELDESADLFAREDLPSSWCIERFANLVDPENTISDGVLVPGNNVRRTTPDRRQSRSTDGLGGQTRGAAHRLPRHRRPTPLRPSRRTHRTSMTWQDFNRWFNCDFWRAFKNRTFPIRIPTTPADKLATVRKVFDAVESARYS